MSTNTPERIDLQEAEDPRDVVHRAVACLAQGGVVLMPGDGSYSLAASVLEPEAVARVARLKRLEGQRGMPITLRSAEELPDWFPAISEVGLHLARRCWPGPLLLLAERAGQSPSLLSRLPAASAELLMPRGWVALASPSQRVPRDIIDLIAGPLVVSAARATGQPPIATVDEASCLDGVDMVLDAGRYATPGQTSVVRLTSDSWELARAGLLDDAEIKRRAGKMILFVCTGNTCRSPMAEALCRLVLAERLGCGIDEVENHGLSVASAGVAAAEGSPAAQHAAEVLRRRGGSLEDHHSQMITPRLIHQADHIIAMTRSHLDVLLDYFPEAGPRARLLHPWGQDVEDPIGSDRENYRRTAEAIEDYLHKLIDALGL